MTEVRFYGYPKVLEICCLALFLALSLAWTIWLSSDSAPAMSLIIPSPVSKFICKSDDWDEFLDSCLAMFILLLELLLLLLVVRDSFERLWSGFSPSKPDSYWDLAIISRVMGITCSSMGGTFWFFLVPDFGLANISWVLPLNGELLSTSATGTGPPPPLSFISSPSEFKPLISLLIPSLLVSLFYFQKLFWGRFSALNGYCNRSLMAFRTGSVSKMSSPY